MKFRIPHVPVRRPSLPVALGIAGGGLVLSMSLVTAMLSSSEGRADTEHKQTAGLAVTTTQARLSTLPLRIPASGTIQAIDEIILGSEVAGLAVSTLAVDEGDAVTKGQVLATLNRSILDAQLAQTNAQLISARASAVEAAANERRAIELGAKGFISKQVIDQRHSTAVSSRAQIEVLEAQRQELEARIAQTIITAPADGVVAVRGVSQGQVVGNGTEMFRIIRGGKLEWSAQVPDYQLTQLHLGQTAQIAVAGEQAVEGSIRLISAKIDARSRNGVVHVELPADTRLRAGMFARGEIVAGDTSALTLPSAAIVTKDGESYVFKVMQDGRVQQTKVETGARTASLVEIRRGIDRGTKVVVDGAGLLSDGDPVRVTGETPIAGLKPA